MSQEANSIHFPPGAVIVIGRQFGSGGRKIGKGIAKRLGIPYYDKALLSKAAESLGFALRYSPQPTRRSRLLFVRSFRQRME